MATAKTKAAAANRAKAGSAASIVKAQNEKTFRSSMPSVTTPSASQNRTNVTLMNAQGQTKTVPQNTAAYNLYTSKGFSEPKPDKFNPDIGQLTPAERIGNKALEPITRVDEKTNQLFGGGKTPAPKTFEEWEKMKARELKRDQEATTKLSEKEAELAMKSDLMGVEDLKKSQKAGMENLKAVYGTDREGGVSTGNQMLPEAYKNRTQGRITLAEQQADFAKEERAKILSDLRKAQENDQKELAKTLLGQLDLAEQEIAKYDERVASIENTRANTQKIQQETTLSNMEAMGSAIGNLTVPELQKMGEGAGFTMPQMLTFQKAYQLRAEADESKNQAEADYKRAQAEELIQSVKWQAEDRPLDVRIKQAEARLMESKAVIEAAASTGKIIDPIKQAELAKQMYELNELRGYSDVSVPDGGDYAIAKTKDGIYVGVEDGTYGGQCGAFVGDVNGKAFIPNSYADKQKLIDKNIVVPVAGMVGITGSQKYPQYGHVFIVEQVNNDGTMNIVESNYYSPEKVGRRKNVPIAMADGFTRMPNARTDQTNSDAGIYTKAQQAAMNSIDPTKITETQKKVLKENGLSSADLFNYISTSKKALPEEKKGDIQAVLDGISTLKEMKKSGAVGVSLQKLLPGVSAEKGFLPASKAADFKAEFDTFKDTLAIPTLDKLKGAMSDKDIQFLRNTATSLSLDMSEKQFEATLAKLEKKYKEILTQGTSIDPEQPKQNNDPLNLYTPTNDPLGLFN